MISNNFTNEQLELTELIEKGDVNVLKDKARSFHFAYINTGHLFSAINFNHSTMLAFVYHSLEEQLTPGFVERVLRHGLSCNNWFSVRFLATKLMEMEDK